MHGREKGEEDTGRLALSSTSLEEGEGEGATSFEDGGGVSLGKRKKKGGKGDNYNEGEREYRSGDTIPCFRGKRGA